MKLSVNEILGATRGKLLKGDNTAEKLSVSTDTRAITGEDIFLPLDGINFNGHDYLEEALKKGCKGYFIDKWHKPVEEPAGFVIAVEDTLSAYLEIAGYAGKKINPKVVAVTGSSGKTSAKEFISSVLSTSFITHKSALNHNNEIGLCRTLLSMPENCEYAVIEMGMRGLGEIALLSTYAEPDIAVITNIGHAHVGRLGSIENIAKAKCEITCRMKKNGVLIALEDELIKKYCDFAGKKIFLRENFKITGQEDSLTEFIYKETHYKIPVPGKYNVINSLFAIETGLLAGVPAESIQSGLLNYAPVGERGKVISLKNNIKLVLDCYNANPESVMASIDSVVSAYKDYKIILVLGDMAELGDNEEHLHREIGHFISKKPVHSLVTVGEKARLIAQTAGNKLNRQSFCNNKDAAGFLGENLEKNTVILFKASRNLKLEEIAGHLM